MARRRGERAESQRIQLGELEKITTEKPHLGDLDTKLVVTDLAVDKIGARLTCQVHVEEVPIVELTRNSKHVNHRHHLPLINGSKAATTYLIDEARMGF